MTSRKLQRWTDLLVALLRYRLGAAFGELAEEVPAYQLPNEPTEKHKATVKRMFERDKAELLAFGVPIETITHDGESEKYRLRPADFYLPYLSVLGASGRRREPRRLDRDGYRSVQELAFEPDELAAIGAAAIRVRMLGNPHLAECARSAMRKLAFDVPGLDGDDQERVVVKGEHIAPAVLPALHEALVSRKQLRFTYHSISRDATESRRAEPLGLFFLNSHWYLAAQDTGGSTIKNFRISRMRDVTANAARPQTADFEIPSDFNLREHARSRLAWDLGDADALDVVVEFTTTTGAAASWLQLGAEVLNRPRQRAFRVRSLERFVRWMLSLAGAVRAVSPPELGEALRQAARETLAHYAERP